MKAFVGAAWREITSAKAFIGGAWRTLTVGKAYNGSAWQSAASFVLPMSLTITPNPCNTGGSYYVVSRTMTATPTGGLGPFTYAWTITAQTGPRPLALNSTSSANTTVGGNITYGDYTFTLQCTVTDSLGTTAIAQVSGVLFDNGRNIGSSRYL